ncbi:MAG TPA: hypothetical protein VMU58_02065 [Gaiellaceae bacterium]|nr:hypothetical protein [Gaiellaceae bacterium]
MPAETERLRRRITRRDRWFLTLLACAALAGTAAAILVHAHGSQPATHARCVSTIRASIVGGATFTYCGARAIVACRRYAGEDDGLAAQCRRLGLTSRHST